MPTVIASLMVWGGYLFVQYGLSQLQGCNTGLRSVAWPGRSTACNPDAQNGNYQPNVGTGPGGSNAGNPPGYSAGSTSPGGSPSTPPAGWKLVIGSPGWYYSPDQPGEIWIPGKGILQQ